MFPWTMTCECTTAEVKLADDPKDARFAYRASSWMMFGAYYSVYGEYRDCNEENPQ